MVTFADHMQIVSAAMLSRADLGERMRDIEREQGFRIVEFAAWFDRDDWTDATIISQDGRRIRLVALEARTPCSGAMTRLIEKITAAGLVPVIVEPNQMIIDWCARHDFRSRTIGRGRYRHHVWYSRRSVY